MSAVNNLTSTNREHQLLANLYKLSKKVESDHDAIENSRGSNLNKQTESTYSNIKNQHGIVSSGYDSVG